MDITLSQPAMYQISSPEIQLILFNTISKMVRPRIPPPVLSTAYPQLKFSKMTNISPP